MNRVPGWGWKYRLEVFTNTRRYWIKQSDVNMEDYFV